MAAQKNEKEHKDKQALDEVIHLQEQADVEKLIQEIKEANVKKKDKELADDFLIERDSQNIINQVRNYDYMHSKKEVQTGTSNMNRVKSGTSKDRGLKEVQTGTSNMNRVKSGTRKDRGLKMNENNVNKSHSLRTK